MDDTTQSNKQMQKEQAKKAAAQRQLFSKLKWWGGLIVAAGLLTAWIYSRYVPVPQQEQNKPLNAATSDDWVKGNSQAPVVLVEYSDFQCPACSSYAPLLKTLNQRYADRLAIVYRHNPLKQIHRQADLAAQAAEAAGKQNKFWEMHDLLFEKQDEWADKSNARQLFEGYAAQLGLNQDQFKQDLQSKEIKGRVKADYVSAIQNRLFATPTFFLNGEKIDNPRTPEEFVKLIEAALPATSSASIQNQ